MKKGYLYPMIIGVTVLLSAALGSAPPLSGADPRAFVNHLKTNSQVASTVPSNGDINPYGVAVVRHSTGNLVRGHVLVSNFNNSSNLQGTGTTVMDISPDGKADVFAQLDAATLPVTCPGGIGLTTALVELRSGWVIVGSLPTSDGTAATAQAGCLLVLDSRGNAVESIHGNPINGPWDMTALDGDDGTALFVTNVLNGTVAAGGSTVNQGTVVRIELDIQPDQMPVVMSETVIGAGFPERTDPAALVIGPTGVGLSHTGSLFVADTLSNRIAAIPDALSRMTSAGTGDTVAVGGSLNGPLGLALAPNGDILVTNGGDGNLVETTPAGKEVAVENIDATATGAGTLFGLSVSPFRKVIYFVNDGNNTLNVLQ